MKNLILRTPLIAYRDLNLSTKMQLFLKPENLQPFGSYKIRGVVSAIEASSAEILQNGICAASAGNLAQAVAFAAREKSIPCRIFVPDSAPDVKKMAIKKLGAELIELPFAQVWDMVRTPPKNFEGLFIHPVFTAGLLEGYSTMADELIQDQPDLDAIIIPFGVGGLTLGIAERIKKINPDIRIYTCEPETAAPLRASLAAGKPARVERVTSFVDAIGTSEVLPEVFERVQPLIAGSIVVTLAEVRSAMTVLATNHKLICEGAAAASLAAALRLTTDSTYTKDLPIHNQGLCVACILSGGNTPFNF